MILSLKTRYKKFVVTKVNFTIEYVSYNSTLILILLAVYFALQLKFDTAIANEKLKCFHGFYRKIP